jgi:toxin ParE1/3/4
LSHRTLVFSPDAERDLVIITTMIAEHAGNRVAKEWRRRLAKRMQSLSSQPRLGMLDSNLGPERRRLVFAPYLIVYELALPGEVSILRIVHGARDLPTLFPSANRD